MADADQPAWLSQPNTAAPGVAPASYVPPGTISSPAAVGGAPAGATPQYKWITDAVQSVINIGLCVFLSFTGVRGIQDSDSVDDTGIVFVAIYLIAFSAILFVYEVVQLYPCEVLDLALKKNFGFLYGVFGKACYLMLVGILAFGLSAPRNLAISCGIVVAAWGALSMLLYLWVSYSLRFLVIYFQDFYWLYNRNQNISQLS